MKHTSTAVAAVLFAILIGATALAIWQQNWSSLFVVGAALGLSAIPYVLHHRYEISISKRMRLGILMFLFGTLFLGEVNHYYEQFQWWDTALHFSAGFGLTLFGFVILKEIYAQSELRSVPIMTTFFAFSFTGMMAAVWEVYEFAIDQFDLAETQMQVNNFDTMIDMIVAMIAALIVSFFGYRSLKMRERNFADKIISGTGYKNNQNE